MIIAMGGYGAFQVHIAVFLGLIALAAGYFVCLKSREDPQCGKWGRYLGMFISLVAVLGIACAVYLSIKRCCDRQDKQGWYKNHMQMMMPEGTGEESK